MFLALGLPAQAQTIHSFLRPTDSLKSVAIGAFSSKDAGFSIKLPQKTGGFSGVTGIEFSWRLEEGYFVAGIVDKAGDIEHSELLESYSDKIIDETYAAFSQQYFATHGEINQLRRSAISFNGKKGREARIELQNSVCIIRVFWHLGRAYKVGVLLVGPQMRFEKRARLVFDSLRYTPKSDPDEENAKIIRENSPSDLPQSPKPIALLPDTKSEKLKGNVRSVRLFRQEVIGSRSGEPNRLSRETNYDRSGFVLRSISYSSMSGAPSSITVYGFIDGNRVSLEKELDSDRMLSSPNNAGTAIIQAKKRDSRFQYRYRFVLDTENRIIEKFLYDNSGELISRSTFDYGPETVDEKRYFDDKLNQHYQTKFDSSENEVEFRSFVSFDGSTIVSRYKINEVDRQGNWIKRIKSIVWEKGALKTDVSTLVETRVIAYY